MMYGIYPYNTSSDRASCWVYILQAEDRRHIVKYTVDIRRGLDYTPPGSRIVFCRGFSDIIDGIAFKVFLQSLSPSSLERVASIIEPMPENESHKPKTTIKKILQ